VAWWQAIKAAAAAAPQTKDMRADCCCARITSRQLLERREHQKCLNSHQQPLVPSAMVTDGIRR